MVFSRSLVRQSRPGPSSTELFASPTTSNEPSAGMNVGYSAFG
jgi:hypothetical protein